MYIEFVRKLCTTAGQQLLATHSVLPIFQLSAKSSFVTASLEELSSESCLKNIPRKAIPLTKTLPPLCLLKLLTHQLLPGLLENRSCFYAEELHVLNQLNKPGSRTAGVCHTSLENSII